MITGNLGGYVILHDANGDGQPDEILIMNTDDITTATQVWRWNKNGLGFATSYAGTYGTAITQDGKIVADYIATGTLDASKITVSHLNASSIDTGTLNADLIKAGTIQDIAGNSTINMTNGVASMKNFDAKYRFHLLSNAGAEKVRLVHNAGQGSNFTFYNESGYDCGGLSSGTNGLQIVAKNGSGTTIAQIEKTDQGGTLFVRNNSAKKVAMVTATSSGGLVRVSDASGTERAVMYSTASNDGYITVKNSSGTVTIYANGGSGVLSCVTLQQTSSRKVKDNIKPIADAQKILELQAVSFDYKNKEQGTNKRGFIAEDVAEVLPNLVTPETEETNASLDYIGMIPYLQAVIKEQDKRIKALESKLEKLGG